VNVTATLIGQLLTFAVLIWFIKAFLWEPILNALEDRKKRIAEGLAAAERGMHEQELAQQRAKEELHEAKQAAVEEAERIKAAAQAEIEQEVNRAREQLRAEVAAIALAGAEKILEREIDASAHKKVLDELAAQI